jgi:acyl-CoA reductase-like NAD-dependent aldehyde dehydrogenase
MTRLQVLKTYKIFIGGQFPRTESGRYYSLIGKDGNAIANVCLSSRKDARNAVVAARKAFGSWSERSAFNRGQIVYRIAEMLEGRRSQFIEELQLMGLTAANAAKEVDASVDRIVYYAGWCDKYQQIVSSVNPVASSHFNFSVAEATGVVGIIAPENSPLLGLVSLLIPAISGGNTVVLVASEKYPLTAVTLAEVIHSSDVPGGVVNVLTGTSAELMPPLASHLDVNAMTSSGLTQDMASAMQVQAAENVKRIFNYPAMDWSKLSSQGLSMIEDLQEIKTTWHPIENIGGATSSY